MMAEDGVDDYALAKRKAVRALGAPETQSLPANEEIELALRAHQSLFQSEEHPDRVKALRRSALDLMQELTAFHPYLTGAILKGTAGRQSEIELHLFPESDKLVELFLLERGLSFTSREQRRFAGDRARAANVLAFDWQERPVRLAIFDSRDERVALKTSLAGRVIERAGIAEVRSLLDG
ncbi:MAG: hypothetical protein HY017_30765 [Betaproteobacteria bacterium]|nr:hypothetical protein [Betaproteobacteria bacterium]